MKRNVYEIESSLIEMMESNHELCNMDDMTLYYNYVSALNPDISGMRFETVMTNREALGLPSISSVSRAKRKIHEKRIDLRPNDYISKRCFEHAEEMIEYAKS